jgi:hypothetical protein
MSPDQAKAIRHLHERAEKLQSWSPGLSGVMLCVKPGLPTGSGGADRSSCRIWPRTFDPDLVTHV